MPLLVHIKLQVQKSSLHHIKDTMFSKKKDSVTPEIVRKHSLKERKPTGGPTRNPHRGTLKRTPSQTSLSSDEGDGGRGTEESSPEGREEDPCLHGTVTRNGTARETLSCQDRGAYNQVKNLIYIKYRYNCIYLLEVFMKQCNPLNFVCFVFGEFTSN